MAEDTSPAICDILTALAPPIRLVMWLRKVFDAKRAKGETVPDAYIAYLERWERIRSDLPAITDTLTDEEWQALVEVVV